MEFEGDFETHWTVVEDRRVGLERITEVARRHGLKVTHIVLSRGASRSQLMLTRRRQTTLSVELADAQSMARGLGREGLQVQRVKIETCVDNDDIPMTNEVARVEASRYFEHHIKVRHERSADLRPVTLVAEAHDAHLSRSVMGENNDGGVQRFVTQRCYGVGLPTAETLLEALNTALADADLDVLSTTQEYVVYDSNIALDAGWIE